MIVAMRRVAVDYSAWLRSFRANYGSYPSWRLHSFTAMDRREDIGMLRQFG